MNTERLVKMVTIDMTSDLLKLEEELERVINCSTMETEKRVDKIKQILNATILIEGSMAKFNSMINNNNLKQEENGKI
jgi:cell division protein ZapA (FtsZ GTPase activity inhibitor)